MIQGFLHFARNTDDASTPGKISREGTRYQERGSGVIHSGQIPSEHECTQVLKIRSSDLLKRFDEKARRQGCTMKILSRICVVRKH